MALATTPAPKGALGPYLLSRDASGQSLRPAQSTSNQRGKGTLQWPYAHEARSPESSSVLSTAQCGPMT